MFLLILVESSQMQCSRTVRSIAEIHNRFAQNGSKEVQCAAVANNTQEFGAALKDEQATWVYFRFLPTKQQMEAVHAAKKRAFIAGVTVSGHEADNWKHCKDVELDAVLTDYPLEMRQIFRTN